MNEAPTRVTLSSPQRRLSDYLVANLRDGVERLGSLSFMFSLRPLVILLYLTFVVLASALSASFNATIDHDDPSVTYSEGWEQVVVGEDSSTCTHMLSSHNPSAYALVKFRGKRACQSEREPISCSPACLL